MLLSIVASAPNREALASCLEQIAADLRRGTSSGAGWSEAFGAPGSGEEWDADVSMLDDTPTIYHNPSFEIAAALAQTPGFMSPADLHADFQQRKNRTDEVYGHDDRFGMTGPYHAVYGPERIVALVDGAIDLSIVEEEALRAHADGHGPLTPVAADAFLAVHRGVAAKDLRRPFRVRGQSASATAKTTVIGDIVIVSSDHWHAIYEDGVLLWEDHRINAKRALRCLGIPHRTMEADLDWLDEAGRFPQDLADVRTQE